VVVVEEAKNVVVLTRLKSHELSHVPDELVLFIGVAHLLCPLVYEIAVIGPVSFLQLIFVVAVCAPHEFASAASDNQLLKKNLIYSF